MIGNASEHVPIGITKIIGPKWDETKEQEFRRMKKMIRFLLAILLVNIVFNLIFLGMLAINE